jgi:periplasmic copper chaperone A
VPRRTLRKAAKNLRSPRPMRKLFVELAAAIALTMGAILALAGGARASDIAVTSAYARASATSEATSGAAYFTLANRGAEADRLLGITTDAAGMVMLHETAMVDGVAAMRHIDSLELPPGAEVKLAPSATHAMLTGLKAPLKKGARISVTLTFEKAGAISIDVPVGSIAQDGPPAD